MLIGGIIAYLLLTLLIGWISGQRIRNGSDFAIAGGQLPLRLLTASFFATWFGAETILGAPYEFYKTGWMSLVEEPLGAALCLILVARFFARAIHSKGYLSIGDLFLHRFGPKAELLSSLIQILSYYGWIAGQMVAFGLLIQLISGIPLGYSIALGFAFILLYTWMGGMWAISTADFMQTLVILGGLFYMLLYFIPETGFQSLDWPKLEIKQHELPDWTSALVVMSLGSIPSQDIYQRVMSGKTANTAVQASWIAGIMYLFIGMLPILILLFAAQSYPGEVARYGQDFLPQLVKNHLPPGIQVFFYGALMSAIMSSASAAMLAPATLMAENVLKPRIREGEQRLLALMRWSLLGIGTLAYAVTLLDQNIHELVLASSSVTLATTFIPFCLALFYKGTVSERKILWALSLGTLGWVSGSLFELLLPPELFGLCLSAIPFITLLFSKKE